MQVFGCIIVVKIKGILPNITEYQYTCDRQLAALAFLHVLHIFRSLEAVYIYFCIHFVTAKPKNNFTNKHNGLVSYDCFVA